MERDVLRVGSDFTKAKRSGRSLNAFGMRAEEDDHELTNSTTRSDPTQHGIARFRSRAAAEDCGARRSGAGGGGTVTGVPRGAEVPRAASGEVAVSWADRRRDDAGGGSDARTACLRPPR